MSGIRYKTFDGHSIDDGVAYNAYTVHGDQPFQRTVDPVLHRPSGKHPRRVRSNLNGHTFPLRIQIRSGDLIQRKDELSRWFKKGTTGDLIVDFDGSERIVSATVDRVIAQDGASNMFTAVLSTPDPRFASSGEQCFLSGALGFTGGLINDTTRAAGTDGDGQSSKDNSHGIWVPTTNLITNGGFENDASGWSTGGTNSIARSANEAKFGTASALCTYSNNTKLAQYDSISLSASSVYMFTAWVRGETGTFAWDGGDFFAGVNGFTGATTDFAVSTSSLSNGVWDRIQVRITTTGATTGNLRIYTDSAPTIGRRMYVDGAQCEDLLLSGSDLLPGSPYVETDGGGTASRTLGRVRGSARKMDETQGWVAARVRFGFTNDPSGSTQHDDAYIWGWGDDLNDTISLRYDDSAAGTDRLRGRRVSGGTADSVTPATSIASGDIHTVIFAWEATQLKLSVDGGAFSRQSSTNIPDLSAVDQFDIGNSGFGGARTALNGDILWIASGTGLLTDADAGTINSAGGGGVNLLLRTEQFNLSDWRKGTGVTVTANQTDDPNSNTTADQIDTAGASLSESFEQEVSGDYSSQTLTFSLYVKGTAGDEVDVRIEDSAGSPDESGTTHALANTDSWERRTHTHTFGAGITEPVVARVRFSDTSGPQTFYAWGAQLEVGATASDYVKVTSGNDVPESWPPLAGKCFHWDGDTVAADTQNLLLNNLGNTVEDEAIFTFQPFTAKTATDSWLYQREVIVANRIGNNFANYMVCLTDDGASGGWNHAAEVTAGQSLSSGNDVRVLVDGVEVPRWVGSSANGWDGTDTKVWINMDLTAAIEAELSVATSASGTEDLVFKQGTGLGLPESGHLLIGTEVIAYSAKTATGVTVSERGARNTSTAVHSVGAAVYWVEHRVRVIYGYTSVASGPDARADLQPMPNLSSSENAVHIWEDFADEDNPKRSMQWLRVLRDRDTQSDKILAPTGGPATQIVLEYQSGGPVSGKPNFNGWFRPFPSGTATTGNLGTVTNYVSTETMFFNFLGVDDSGQERSLLAVLGGTGNQTITAPSDPLYRLEFSARNAIVARHPKSNQQADDQLIDAIGDSVLRQKFKIPTSRDPIPFVDGYSFEVKIASAGTAVVRLRIKKEDSTGSLVEITDQTENLSSTSYVFLLGEPIGGISVLPSDTLTFELAWNGTSSGSPDDVIWRHHRQSFLGEGSVHGFRLLSNTLDHDSQAIGVDGDQCTADDITVNLDTAAIPYVDFRGQQDLYWLDGTLTNTETSQAATLAIPVDLEDEVEIDVGERTATNVTTGESVLFGVTFTDESDWFSVDPGLTELSYVESGLVSVEIGARWRSRWET